jgi:hypothetical protein
VPFSSNTNIFKPYDIYGLLPTPSFQTTCPHNIYKQHFRTNISELWLAKLSNYVLPTNSGFAQTQHNCSATIQVNKLGGFRGLGLYEVFLTIIPKSMFERQRRNVIYTLARVPQCMALARINSRHDQTCSSGQCVSLRHLMFKTLLVPSRATLLFEEQIMVFFLSGGPGMSWVWHGVSHCPHHCALCSLPSLLFKANCALVKMQRAARKIHCLHGLHGLHGPTISATSFMVVVAFMAFMAFMASSPIAEPFPNLVQERKPTEQLVRPRLQGCDLVLQDHDLVLEDINLVFQLRDLFISFAHHVCVLLKQQEPLLHTRHQQGFCKAAARRQRSHKT